MSVVTVEGESAGILIVSVVDWGEEGVGVSGGANVTFFGCWEREDVEFLLGTNESEAFRLVFSLTSKAAN